VAETVKYVGDENNKPLFWIEEGGYYYISPDLDVRKLSKEIRDRLNAYVHGFFEWINYLYYCGNCGFLVMPEDKPKCLRCGNRGNFRLV